MAALDELVRGPPRWYGDQTRTIITTSELFGIVGEFGQEPDVGFHLNHGVFLTDGGENGQGVTYDSHTSVTVDLLQAATGDANGDRQVNFADLWLIFVESGKYGTGEPATWAEGDVAPSPRGDYARDGRLNFYDLWATFVTSGLYNTGIYTGKRATTGVAVPEPGTVAMLPCGVLGLLLWRWRKRRNR